MNDNLTSKVVRVLPGLDTGVDEVARIMLGLDFGGGIALELIAGPDQAVRLVFSCSREQQARDFQDLLAMTHPGSELEEPPLLWPDLERSAGFTIAPERPDFIPLSMKPQGPALSSLLVACCSSLVRGEVVRLTLDVETVPTKDWRARAEDMGETILRRTDLGGDALRALFGFTSAQAAERQIGEAILWKSQQRTLVRVHASLRVACLDTHRTRATLNAARAAVKSFNATLNNPLATRPLARDGIEGAARIGSGFMACHVELAQLWRPPARNDVAPSSMLIESRRVRASKEIPSTGVVIGSDPSGRPVAIGSADFPLHGAAFGRTGHGKTTVLSRIAVELAALGYTVLAIDPKDGALLEVILANLPDARLDSAILLDAADPDFVVGLSPLRPQPNVPEYLAASDMASAFEKALGAYWSPRIQSDLVAAFRGCLSLGLHSLMAVWPVLSEQRLRRAAINAVADPMIADSLRELDNMTPSARAGRLAPLRNRFSVLLSNPAARDVIGQSHGVDLRGLIDDGAVVLVRLPSGLIGEDAAGTVGSILITMIQHAVQGRVSGLRGRPVALVVDEAQRFTTNALVRLLSEARAFQTSLFLGTQYAGQLTEDISEAVLANASVILQFAASAPEARQWHGRLAPFTVEDIVNLPRFQAAASLPAGAARPPAFTLLTNPYAEADNRDRWNYVRRRTIDRFARPRGDVQRELEQVLRRREPGDTEEERPDVDFE